MPLTDLPNEIFLLLGESPNLDLAGLNSLSRVNHNFHDLLTTPLYRRALTDNRSKAFKTAILCKRDGLVRRIIHEASLIHGWSWAILQANWDRDESQGMIRYLVAKERNVDITQEGQYYGQDILHTAIKDLDSVTLKYILDNDGAVLGPQAVAEGKNHVYNAALSGHSDLVRPLLRHNFPVDVVGDANRSPLIVAAMKCNRNMVKDLLEAGASVAIQDSTLNLTALGWAIMSNAPAGLISLLIEHGSDPNIPAQPYNNLLHMAIRTHSLNAIRPLLEAGVAGPSQANCDHLVAELYIQGQTDLIKWLSEHNPSLLDRTDRAMPWELVDRAVRDVGPNSPITLRRLLREWNVDPNEFGGEHDETLLMSVLRKRYLPIMDKVETLLRYGADPNVCSTSKSPLSLALSVPDDRELDLVRLMLKYGLKFGQCTLSDREDLMSLALRKGANDVVIKLALF